MRKSLIERGKWKHTVPRQEEGEPSAKQGRWYENTLAGLDVGAPLEKTPEQPATGGESPESLPSLEGSPTAEGTWRTTGSVFLHGLNLNLQC